jgi:hypothetical protein
MTLKSISRFIFLLLPLASFGQHSKGKVSLELSIPHTSQLTWIKNCTDTEPLYVIVRNDTDSIHHFYEDWNSFGYYNISFEIRYRDSIYAITRPEKLWYRNYGSYHFVHPHESLVFSYSLLDTMCTNSLSELHIFTDGWTGFPNIKDTAEIRAIYQLCHLEDSVADDWSRRLRTTKDDYVDFLDGDIETEPDKELKHEIKSGSKDPVIFHEPLVSSWQRVVLK